MRWPGPASGATELDSPAPALPTSFTGLAWLVECGKLGRRCACGDVGEASAGLNDFTSAGSD